MANAPYEQVVRFHAPMPDGYTFVPKGNVYVTANCRKLTHAAGRPVYVVVDKHKAAVGLRCPAAVHAEVRGNESATRQDRREAVRRRDDAAERALAREVHRQYPALPPDALPALLRRCLEKGRRRVGRTATIGLRERARLAVRAHVRHCRTDYDRLLRAGTPREAARRLIYKQVCEVEREWGGRTLGDVAVAAKKASVNARAVVGREEAQREQAARVRRLRLAGADGGEEPNASDGNAPGVRVKSPAAKRAQRERQKMALRMKSLRVSGLSTRKPTKAAKVEATATETEEVKTSSSARSNKSKNRKKAPTPIQPLEEDEYPEVLGTIRRSKNSLNERQLLALERRTAELLSDPNADRPITRARAAALRGQNLSGRPGSSPAVARFKSAVVPRPDPDAPSSQYSSSDDESSHDAGPALPPVTRVGSKEVLTRKRMTELLGEDLAVGHDATLLRRRTRSMTTHQSDDAADTAEDKDEPPVNNESEDGEPISPTGPVMFVRRNAAGRISSLHSLVMRNRATEPRTKDELEDLKEPMYDLEDAYEDGEP